MTNPFDRLRRILLTGFVMFILLPLTGCTLTVAMLGADAIEREAWKEQALNGDAEAQYELGKASCCGFGSFYDSKKALDWWCLAANEGHVGAQFEIAKLYENTQDIDDSEVPEDKALAYSWYRVASNNGHDKAEKYLQSLTRNMTEVEYRNAKWIKRFYGDRPPCRLDERNAMYRKHIAMRCPRLDVKECI
ncbi:MAG: sel1 repeat family protein [Hyphomicrobiales bacterium]|nr:sel1 repeat family protein [Rickettsiales bacterium]MCP5362331.1 sel1 repeat family protein [Hyphomicrobiales bacterium]